MRNIAIIGSCDAGGIGFKIAEALLFHHPEDNFMVVHGLPQHHPENRIIISEDLYRHPFESQIIAHEVNNYEFENNFKKWLIERMFISYDSDKSHQSILLKCGISTFRELQYENNLIQEKKSIFGRKQRNLISSIYLKITTK